MIPEKMLEVLKYEGVVAIVTNGSKESHVVNTWNSYLKITEDDKIIAPVGGMNTTEANLQLKNKVKVTLGSREVQGFHSKGTGFLIVGTAEILKGGPQFEEAKGEFPWARAVIEITPESITQTL